ncbi:PP0621 family protein [Aliarcobacter lanthieri]|uniref:PP0621 family protein n=1 Tax=Aliarcobacter lanthieri TaxID=1355374 RepID=UPI003AAEEB60
MLAKLLGLIIVGFLIYIIFFKKSRKSDIKKDDKLISDEMVECPTCKTFVSQKESIVSNGKFYCSKDCLEKR